MCIVKYNIYDDVPQSHIQMHIIARMAIGPQECAVLATIREKTKTPKRNVNCEKDLDGMGYKMNCPPPLHHPWSFFFFFCIWLEVYRVQVYNKYSPT